MTTPTLQIYELVDRSHATQVTLAGPITEPHGNRDSPALLTVSLNPEEEQTKNTNKLLVDAPS